MLLRLGINNTISQVGAKNDLPLLWVLPDLLELIKTKHGFGIGTCGTCTLHLSVTAIRSCQVTVAACKDQTLTTTEGLSSKGDHSLQLAWQEMNLFQFGYCQARRLIKAASLLARMPNPSDENIS